MGALRLDRPLGRASALSRQFPIRWPLASVSTPGPEISGHKTTPTTVAKHEETFVSGT